VKKYFQLILVACLATAGVIAHAQSKAEQKFPGMVLEEGQTMADLGRGERISQPAQAALDALESDDLLAIETGDWIVMRPENKSPDTGLVFYHGAETDPRVYGRPLRAIAEEGYLVVAVTMPRYMAVMAPDKADEVLARFPEIGVWAIGGHSMGGAMAAQYTYKNRDKVAGLLLWDAYPPANVDLRNTSALVAQIYRTDMEGNAPENFREVAHLMPANALLFPIRGAEHTYFGDYILANHRPEPKAEISLEEQMALVIGASQEFMQRLHSE
jgi:pimeloyl-ACP methyl ester carboxylesterase